MREIRNTGVQDWRTPRWLFERLDREFRFVFDAAALNRNSLCPFYFGPDNPLKERRDATAIDWVRVGGHTAFFLNPPFQRIAPFLVKAWEASVNGATVACLLPARVEVAWAHELVYPFAREIRFVRGRVRYYRSTGTGRPNFPSIVVVYGPGAREGALRIRTIER